MADAWNWAVARYGDKSLFATRDILGEEDEIQPNGKLFRKLGNQTVFDLRHIKVYNLLIRSWGLPLDEL